MYIGTNVYFSIIVFSRLSSTKPCPRFLLSCFAREIKGFYQSSLENQVDFKNLRHGFVDERALITTTLISFCHWKTLVPFCLWMKRPEKAFLTLTVNCRKIVQKNETMPPKATIKWLFIETWCYLFIASFFCKICVFQQTKSCKGILYP